VIIESRPAVTSKRWRITSSPVRTIDRGRVQPIGRPFRSSRNSRICSAAASGSLAHV
jgi:hypothetical protein